MSIRRHIASTVQILQLFQSLQITFREYLASISQNDEIKYIAKKRRLQYLWNPERVIHNPSLHKSTAVLFGSGESVNEYRAYFVQSDHHVDSALKRVFDTSYIVHLNTTIFSDIPCHLALFEVPANRYWRGIFDQLFEDGCHLKSLREGSTLVFTHCYLDRIDDYIRSGISPNTCLLPQMLIFPPIYQGRYGLVIYRLIFLFHYCFSQIRLFPRAIWSRGSSVRAVWLLALAGYKVIYMIGFDGSTNYFYSDSNEWPKLGPLRALRDFLSASQIEIMVSGRKTFKKGLGGSALHPSVDSRSCQYTCPVIIRLIAAMFRIELIYL